VLTYFPLQARANKSKDKPDLELDEFEKVNEESTRTYWNTDLSSQILEEHKLQGQEDQALEKRVEGKKAAAKKRAARKSNQFHVFFLRCTNESYDSHSDEEGYGTRRRYVRRLTDVFFCISPIIGLFIWMPYSHPTVLA